MEATIITLWDPRTAEHYCAVVEDKVSHEDLAKLAKTLDAYIEGEEGFDEDEVRQLFKTEINTCSTIGNVGLSDLYTLY